MDDRRQHVYPMTFWGLMCLHAAMLAWGAYRHSPTMDEPAYLAGGLSHWRFGQFELTKVSPPLIRLVAAIPVSLISHEEDWGNFRVGPGIRPEHAVGHDFQIINGRRTFWLFTIGRWACIPFSLIGACVCYRWALELWGIRSAWCASLLWCFSPNVLAHGQMLTPDIGVTSLSLAAGYLYWRWTRHPSWASAVVMGAVLGLALLAKTNAIVLYGVLPLTAFYGAVSRSGHPGTKKLLFQLAASVTMAIYIVNLGYGFDGSFTQLNQYQFASTTFRGAEAKDIGNRFKDTAIGAIPVPFPKAFLDGIDLQRRDFENGHGRTMTYWRGNWYNHSWWWYYVYATAVKSTLGILMLVLLSCVIPFTITKSTNSTAGAGGTAPSFRSQRGRWFATCGRLIDKDLVCLILPGLALFGIASSQTGFGHALRYVVPAFPFAMVFASGAVRSEICSRAILNLAAISVTWHLCSSTAVFPHSLAYFNEVAGGPIHGHAHLLDGNLDWGQDLLYLEEWMNNHPEAQPVHVGYWGTVPVEKLMPSEFSNLEFQPQTDDASPPGKSGWYAVSVNHLRTDFRMGRKKYSWFLTRQPDAMAGYSIYIFHVDGQTNDD